MAYELYSSTSKQFLKESLNIHLGLVAKTVLIALPVRVIYLSVLGPVFFSFFSFLEKYRYRLSEFEYMVKTIAEITKKTQGC